MIRRLSWVVLLGLLGAAIPATFDDPPDERLTSYPPTEQAETFT